MARLWDRVRRAWRRYGACGIWQRAWMVARGRVVLSESHVWYQLDLGRQRPRPPLQPRLTLRRGDHADLPLLEQLPTTAGWEASARLEAGNDVWLVVEDRHALFSCWIFHTETPVVGAPGGALRLADQMVCLEDSVVSGAARGRGIAPSAWAAIADVLTNEGKGRIITKVEVENKPSRRAVEKAGFEPVAVMHFKRLGPRSRTRIEVLENGPGSFFAESLSANHGKR